MNNWQWPTRKEEFWRSSQIWSHLNDESWVTCDYYDGENNIIQQTEKQILVPNNLNKINHGICQMDQYNDSMLTQIGSIANKHAVELADGVWRYEVKGSHDAAI